MRIQNTKTERAFRTLNAYLRPKLRRAANIEFTSAFVGANDSNIARRIPQIVEDVMLLTHGELAMDADASALHRRMRAAIDDDGTPATETGDDVVDEVLELLAHKLLPHELAAVRQILTQRRTPSRKAAATQRNVGDVAEDIATQAAFDHRFPSAARLSVEPVARPERQPQPASGNLADFYTRFPSTRRIGLA
jgi:hypothetical protein